MIYAHIMAGGIGKRMGNIPLPKQYLTLGNKPIIVHTVEKFVLNSDFNLIIVSTPENWINYTIEIFEKNNLTDERIRIIAGGDERNDNLSKAIQYISDTNGIFDDDVIVAHDAVRPFLTKKIIDDNIKASKNFSAIDTVIPAYDTIVKGDGNEVHEIPVRDIMYQGQTPQTFNIKKFQECFKKLSDSERLTLSDSCKIMLLGGERVGMVEGDSSNIKITTPYDLKIANSIIEYGHTAQ